MSKKKKETLSDIEKRELGDFRTSDFPDTDKKESEEKPKGKRVKKQSDLGLDIQQTDLEKQAGNCANVWDEIQTMKKLLKEECDKLLPLMKESKKSSITITSESGERLEIKITTGDEKIKIGKKKEVEL